MDEANGVVFYMARDGDNPYKLQLHRVGLNGKGEKRLTDSAYNHAVQIAPDNQHFIDVAQTHDTPPMTRLADTKGGLLETLAPSAKGKMADLAGRTTEWFTFKAADGKTDLYGMVSKPSDFDPTRKYPVLVSVYGGPESSALSEDFRPSSALTELGFLVAEFDGRGNKRERQSVYGRRISASRCCRN